MHDKSTLSLNHQSRKAIVQAISRTYMQKKQSDMCVKIYVFHMQIQGELARAREGEGERERERERERMSAKCNHLHLSGKQSSLN